MSTATDQVSRNLARFFQNSVEAHKTLLRHDITYFQSYVDLIICHAGSNHSLSVLDLGCGTGLSTSILKRLGFSAIGIDLSTLNLKTLDLTERPPLATADSLYLPFADNSFDIVATNNVVEFFTDPNRAFSEIARVTKEEGKLVLRAPNLLSPYMSLIAIRTGKYARGSSPYRGSWLVPTLGIAIRNTFTLFYKYLTVKGLGLQPQYSFRMPVLDNHLDAYGQDYDSVFLSNPIDLVAGLENAGFIPISIKLYNLDPFDDNRHGIESAFVQKTFSYLARKISIVCMKPKGAKGGKND